MKTQITIEDKIQRFLSRKRKISIHFLRIGIISTYVVASGCSKKCAYTDANDVKNNIETIVEKLTDIEKDQQTLEIELKNINVGVVNNKNKVLGIKQDQQTLKVDLEDATMNLRKLKSNVESII